MSGGSWGYAYARLAEVVDALKNDTTSDQRTRLKLNDEQLLWRHKLAKHLEKVSTALHAIEWVDSYDTSYPSDVDAIKKIFDDPDPVA